MKLLVVTYGLNTLGGVQSWQHLFVHELIEKGFDITILELYDYSEKLINKKIERSWDSKAKIVKCSEPIIKRSVNPYSDLAAVKVILGFFRKKKNSKMLEKDKYEVILFTDPNFIFYFSKKVLKRNYCIVQYHNSFERFKRSSWLRYYLIKKQLSIFKKVIFLSKSDVELAYANGFDSNKIDYIPNFVPAKKFEYRKKDYSKSYKQILVVGRLQNCHKQIDQAIESFSIIGADVRNGWILKVIGDGEDKDELIALAKKLRIESQVIFAGSKNNPIDDYFESDFFILSSAYEGLPLTLLECIFTNLPILAYDCAPSIREIVVDNFNGFVVRKNDIVELSNKIQLLIKNRNEILRLSSNQDDLKSKFSSESTFKRWERIMRSR